MGGRPLNHTFCCLVFFFFFPVQPWKPSSPSPAPRLGPAHCRRFKKVFHKLRLTLRSFTINSRKCLSKTGLCMFMVRFKGPPSGGGARKCDRWPCQPRRNQVSDGCLLHCPAVLLLVHTQHSYVPLGGSRSVLTPKGLLLFFSPLAKCFSASLMLITIQLKWNMVPQRKT